MIMCSSHQTELVREKMPLCRFPKLVHGNEVLKPQHRIHKHIRADVMAESKQLA